eukprot:TRINITY_DN16461_c0_g1_i1.p1 TRINITY_DN16461_c0_g1~~TRINITY_DN16461_c0_g1_i1.p1  ORF type:complete len:245 (+),score=71.47 TRINITY_DN16461_c0_g1_i1:132-866(+)
MGDSDVDAYNESFYTIADANDVGCRKTLVEAHAIHTQELLKKAHHLSGDAGVADNGSNNHYNGTGRSSCNDANSETGSAGAPLTPLDDGLSSAAATPVQNDAAACSDARAGVPPLAMPPPRTLDEQMFDEDYKCFSPTSKDIIRNLGVRFAEKFNTGELSEDYRFPCDVTSGYDITRHDLKQLDKGKAFFAFICKVESSLTDTERKLASLVLNKTAFADETAENNAPIIDMFDMVCSLSEVFFL